MSTAIATSPRDSPGQRTVSRAWWLFILAGVVLMLGYALTPDGLVRDLFYIAVGIGCVTAIMVGVRLHEPARPQPWMLMALGQLLWVIGDTLYSIHDLAGSDSFPAAGDYFYLAGYPVLALGLFHLVNRTRSSGDLPGTLDTWTTVVGLTLVSYELLGRPAIDTGVSAMATLVSVAYPFGDILLLAGLVGLVTTTGWWNPSIKLLLTAVSLQLVADTASTSLGIYSQLGTSGLNYLWLAAYIGWGAAALHPTMAQFSEPVPDADPHFRRGRLLAAGAATLVAPAILAVQGAPPGRRSRSRRPGACGCGASGRAGRRARRQRHGAPLRCRCPRATVRARDPGRRATPRPVRRRPGVPRRPRRPSPPVAVRARRRPPGRTPARPRRRPGPP